MAHANNYLFWYLIFKYLIVLTLNRHYLLFRLHYCNSTNLLRQVRTKKSLRKSEIKIGRAHV